MTYRKTKEKGLLSHGEVIGLGMRVASGDEQALEELVTGNLGLVKWIAKRWVGRGLEWDELVSLGNVGLIKAAKRFDWRRGKRFSTYAKYLIEEGMRAGIKKRVREIEAGVEEGVLDIVAGETENEKRVKEGLMKVNRDKRILIELRYGVRDGQERTLKEVGRIMGLSREKVRQIEKEGEKDLRKAMERG